jgi:hypothetical protein
MSPRQGSKPRLTDRLVVGHNVTLTWQRLGKNLPIFARQRLSTNVTAVMDAHNNRRTFGRIIFSVARVVSRNVDD